MNNQNNQNNFNDQNEDKKGSSLPEVRASERDEYDVDGAANGKGPSPKVNRALYVTAIVLLLSVAIIAAVTSAANRSKKKPLETPAETSGVQTPAETPSQSSSPEASSSTPESTEPEESTGNSADVSGKLPVFALPVSGVLGVKHDPDLQVFSPTMKEYRVHLGIDINTTEGAPVYAAASGKVSKIWNDPMMGWCIELTHSGQAVSYYKNLSETLATGISEGVSVKEGQLLGAVGESAMLEVAQEPHLHFEMKVGGIPVDPLDYFSADELASLGIDESYEG